MGYKYCGPGTKLTKRLGKKDPGINPLDAACKNHDIAYKRHPTNLNARHQANNQLEQAACEIFKTKDASVGEKAKRAEVSEILYIQIGRYLVIIVKNSLLIPVILKMHIIANY